MDVTTHELIKRFHMNRAPIQNWKWNIQSMLFKDLSNRILILTAAAIIESLIIKAQKASRFFQVRLDFK